MTRNTVRFMYSSWW